MKKEMKIVIGVVLSVLLLVILGLVLIFGRAIPMNPEGTVGNTAGNLNNSGLFCEYDGTVYFSNAYDGGSLYAMSPDESDIRKLNSLQVQNILAGGKFLYYFQTGTTSGNSGFGQLPGVRSFDRCDLRGNNSASITADVVVTGQLVDNYLFLLTSTNSGPSFYKIKIDKSDKVILADYNINPACAENGSIYYNGTQEDHYLYRLNAATDVSTEIWRGNLWFPILVGDYLYYMDVPNNYRLCRYSMSQNVIEVLTEDRVDCFNVGNGYIYYQKNGADAQLKCMRMDGSDVRVIAEGNYTNINMTSQFVYFQAFGEDDTMYHSYLGSSTYESFHAAERAVEN